MAMEPITLYSRAVDPAKVAQRIRESAPFVKIDGPDENWSSARISFGGFWKKKTF